MNECLALHTWVMCLNVLNLAYTDLRIHNGNEHHSSFHCQQTGSPPMEVVISTGHSGYNALTLNDAPHIIVTGVGTLVHIIKSLAILCQSVRLIEMWKASHC